MKDLEPQLLKIAKHWAEVRRARPSPPPGAPPRLAFCRSRHTAPPSRLSSSAGWAERKHQRARGGAGRLQGPGRACDGVCPSDGRSDLACSRALYFGLPCVHERLLYALNTPQHPPHTHTHTGSYPITIFPLCRTPKCEMGRQRHPAARRRTSLPTAAQRLPWAPCTAAGVRRTDPAAACPRRRRADVRGTETSTWAAAGAWEGCGRR